MHGELKMLDKNECLFERDEESKLIGKKVVLETMPGTPEVRIRPLTRGKLMSIYNKAKDGTSDEKIQADNEVIKEGLIDPLLTDEEVEVLKPKYASAISIAIMAISLGIEQEEVGKTTEALAEQETLIKK